MIKILLFIFLTLNLYAKEFTIASYNVENLFDLKKHNSEYKEYIPNTKSKWNKQNFNIKLNNTVKVIKEINADIIALQEIENKNILQLLLKKLPEYKYISFTKYRNSSVGLGFLSKIKITENRQIDVRFSNKLFRPILESTFKIQNYEFKVFNNHWPSKRVAESYRIKFAKKLQNRLSKLPKDYDYILLGDFNSNYDEMQSFKYNKKLNNTDGITGINQILNTTIDNKYITYDDVLKIRKKVHFNLWLDLKRDDRFSNKYRKENNTPDNIIISPALLDTKKISYIPKSLRVFKPTYLYKNHKVNRWKMQGSKYNRVHLGKGYSDHLPIYAKFSTSKEDTNVSKKVLANQKKDLSLISDLYKKSKLMEAVLLKNAVVIYKNNNSVIIKQKNDRAIYIYKNAEDLKLGNSYDIQINQVFDYNGLKEIKDFSIQKHNGKYNNYNSLILNAKNIDILDNKYENEVISNLRGKVKRNYLYYNNDRIRLYAKDKTILPKDNSKIKIINGHRGVFRGNPQILLHKKSDYRIEF